MNKNNFYLGTHCLDHIDKTEFPLFVSINRLRKRKIKKFKRKSPIYVDSGAFTELSINGEWKTSPKQYIEELNKIIDLGLDIKWASPQDYMCEPQIINKTGLSIKEHQKRTIDNVIELRKLTNNIHIIPVLQGQTIQDYYNHFEMYEVNGFNLRNEKIVGVGSICRRQNTKEIENIIKSLYTKGLNLHGFGVKINGLKRYSKYLHSCDSMSWSFHARKNKIKCKECFNKNIKHCGNCINYALQWRNKVIKGVEN